MNVLIAAASLEEHLPFEVGQLYKRRQDIHGRYGGQQQGGIATPAQAPFVLLFTGPSGSEFGYADAFQADGLFWYTGEGQRGDMQLVRGNAAIAQHAQNGKRLLMFEAADKGHVRFVGEMQHVGHHWEQRPDGQGDLRQAIVFHLALLPEVSQPSNCASGSALVVQETSPIWGASSPQSQHNLALLRLKALSDAQPQADVQARLVNVRQRSQAIKAYALARAQGRCEACQQVAPFEAKTGPYLEVHHVYRLADGGPDHPNKVMAVCPNCHRKAHHAKDAAAFNAQLKAWLQAHEPH